MAFHCDLSGQAFSIGSFSIHWYGVFFALGCALGWNLFLKIADRQASYISKKSLDSLLPWIMIGIILGARLFHLIAYEPLSLWLYHDPWLILKFRQGGLASHGGIIGAILALAWWRYFYVRSISFLRLLDLLMAPSLLLAVFIRLGNFCNQEIVGVQTSMPWGVIFSNPLGAKANIPLHPVQLYEAALYLFLFFAARHLLPYKMKEGKLFGLSLFTLFLGRFFLEFLKLPMSPYEPILFLSMGQLLSLPFMGAGLWFIFKREELPLQRSI